MIKNRRGFTFIEAVLSSLISLVIMTAIYMVVIRGSESWSTNNVYIELQQELRKGSIWLSGELRQSGADSITNVPADGTWYNAITFKKANGVSGGAINWSDEIAYAIGGSGSDELQRTESSTTRIIAQNLKTFQVRRQAASENLIEVSLEVEKTSRVGQAMNADTAFKVRMRN